MKKYTQEEFDQFPVNEYGYKQCPTGDYTLIKSFHEWCSFGERCSFGKGCSFGNGCSFGKVCSFGKGCSFGNGCSFGKVCFFSERCSFGEWCSFGNGCFFGERCSFGECSFGERCFFGERCKCEFGELQAMYTAGGFGSKGRTTYFFHMADGGVCVRCGCFAGSIDEWEETVNKTHGNSVLAESYLLIGKAVRAICEKPEEE